MSAVWHKKKNGIKAMKFWPKFKNINNKKKKKTEFKEGLTFGGNILTFGFDLLTFDPSEVSQRFRRF